MKNASPDMIRQCLFLKHTKFSQLISELTDGTVLCRFPIDGIEYESIGTKNYEDNDINYLLSEYFGIKVKSVHIDDNELDIGVWIHYENI